MNSDCLQTLLLKAIQTEIESQLNQSLHQRVYLTPGETDPDAIAPSHNLKLKISPNIEESLTQNTHIEQIFDRPDIQGRLLIRGVAGSGKTTLLLQLATALVDRATASGEFPLPILLDISSWPQRQQSIEQWVITTLKYKYALDRKTAQHLLHPDRIILLFDGLDRLEESQQHPCLQQLNSFVRDRWSGGIAICTGLIESPTDGNLLHINAAIELRSLTPAQISAYLSPTDGEHLWTLIKTDSNLIKIASVPLYLNLIILSATEINVAQWQQMTNTEQREKYLWNAYIRTGLKRGQQKNATNKYTPEDREILHKLSWLATQARKQPDNLAQFNSSWLENPLEKVASVAIVAVIVGAIVGIIFWLMFDRTFGLIFGATLGVIVEILAGNFIDRLMPQQLSISVSKETAILGISGTLLTALICGVIAGGIFWPILGQDSGLVYGSLFAINGGLIFALVMLFTGGLSSPESRIMYQIKAGDRPKMPSRQNLFPYLILTVPMGTFWLWIVWTLQWKKFWAWQLLGGGIVIGGLLAIAFGAMAAIHQFSIRLILWLNRRIPGNYQQFLNYAKNCLFLQQIRGVAESYRFIHPLLCDHFANDDAMIKPHPIND